MEDRRVGYGIAAVILTLGLTARVTYWDANLLSESLAISATAFLIAALAHIDRCPPTLLIAAFTLWVFVRDGHVYVGLIVVVGVCWWGARNRRWIAPACIIAVTVWCGLAEKNNRYVEGFNVGTNIAVLAPHGSENYEWFRQHGMPDSAALETPGWRDRSWALWDDQTVRRLGARRRRCHVRQVPGGASTLDGGRIGAPVHRWRDRTARVTGRSHGVRVHELARPELRLAERGFRLHHRSSRSLRSSVQW